MIQSLIDAYRKDLQPRYATTINIEILDRANSWNGRDPRFYELMHILRLSDLTTTETLPLVWLSSLLGERLKGRVAGIDLITSIAEKMSERKQSLFLLGGDEKALKLCRLYLEALYPDLKITGSLCPSLYTQGIELHNAEEKDSLLIEQINRSKPDLLLINLGNPKQEIWFERVKDRLHVPVSMGIGGIFEQLTGIVPHHQQRKGWEWLFRLIKEPSRLWKHYVCGTLKFIYMSLPLVLYHNINRLIFWFFHRTKAPEQITPQLFISAKKTLTVVKLPPALQKESCQNLMEQVDDLFGHDLLLFDFQHVRHIDTTGIGILLTLWKRAERESRKIYGLRLSADMVLLLRLHRIWDLLRPSFCDHLDDLIARIIQNSNSSFFDSIQQDHHTVVISFFGRVDYHLNVDDYLKKIEPIIHQKPCVIDMTYCTYLDNRAIGFLVKLAVKRSHQKIPMKLTGVSSNLKRQLRLSKVDHLFTIL